MRPVTRRGGRYRCFPERQMPKQLHFRVSLPMCTIHQWSWAPQCDKEKRACSGSSYGGCQRDNNKWYFFRVGTQVLNSGISLQIYAVCRKILVSAWPIFIAGGIIRKMIPVPSSSMVAAKETETTSKPKICVRIFAPKNVSSRGLNIPSSPGPRGRSGCWLVHSRRAATLAD